MQGSEVWQRPEGLKVLATYTQGRFDDHGLYLVPPKGSIDPLKDDAGKIRTDAQGNILYETTLQGAIRECREETGVDIEKLLGEHYADFLAGKTIEHVTSTGYPGVEIVRASPQPVDSHTYISGHGAQQHVQYFALEVRGIEKLRGALKCVVPGEHALKPEDRKTSAELAKEKGLPTFEEMLNILRTGVVPGRKNAVWADAKPKRIIEKTALVLGKFEKQWLHDHRSKHKQLNRDEWLEFIADPKLGGNYKILEAQMEALKKHFESKKIIGDCDGCMKMDTKDRPLNFYKEGGYIGRASDIIMSMETMAEKNPLYARATWGEYSGPKRPDVSEVEQMQRAQIAPFIRYLAGISPMEVASACIRRPKSVEAFNAGKEEVQVGTRVGKATESFVQPIVDCAEHQGKVGAQFEARLSPIERAANRRMATLPTTDDNFTHEQHVRRKESLSVHRRA